MKNRISQILLILIFVCCGTFTTSAATDISPTDETAITTINYDVGTSSTDLALDGTGGLIIASGQYASYTVNAQKAGYYKLLVYGKYVSATKPTVTVSGVNGTAGMGISTTTVGRYTLGRYYLIAGSNSIVLTVTNGTINIRKLYLKSVERTIASVGITKIEAHDYYSSNISSNACEDLQWEYPSANTDAPVVTGPVILYTGAPASQVKYKFNIEQAGSYRLKLYGAKREGDTNFALSVGNAQISQATVPKTSKFLSCMPGESGLFNLKSGSVEITVKEIASATADPFFCFWLTLERVGDNAPIVISETDQTAFSTNQYSDIEGAAINTDGTVILNEGEWISYTVNVTKAGYYKLLVYGKYVGISKPTVTVSGVDGTAGAGISSASDIRNTMGRYYLNAGLNSIVLTVTSGTINIKTLYLKNVEHIIDEEREKIIEAHDYFYTNINESSYVDSQWDYSTENIANVQGAIVFNGESSKTVTYKLNVVKSGLYDLRMYAASTTQDANFVVIKDGSQVSQCTLPKVPAEVTEERITYCMPGEFDSFYFDAGYNEITISDVGGDSNIKFCYYFTLELLGDIYSGMEIAADGSTKLEAECFTSSRGMVQNMGSAMAFSNNQRLRYDINAAQSGSYTLSIDYFAENNTPIKLLLNGEAVFNVTLGVSKNGYEENALAILNLYDGLNSIIFVAGGAEITLDCLRLYRVTSSEDEAFTNAVNSAVTDEMLIKTFNDCRDTFGIDIDVISVGIIYKTPIYKRLIYGEFKDAKDVLVSLHKAVADERAIPKLKAYKGDEQIFSIESGDLRFVLNTTMLREPITVIAAIHKGNSLYRLELCNYVSGGSLMFDFLGTQINSTDEYTFKLYYFENLDSLKPYDAFPQVFRDIYVSENGDDVSGDGTINAPFKSISRSKEEVALINDNQWGDIIVNILPGYYKLDSTEVFGVEHSGKNGFDVIIRGIGTEKPVISGGIEVMDWTQYNSKIWKAPLNVDYVRNMYVNGYPAVRARSEYCCAFEEVHNIAGSSYARDGFAVTDEHFPESLSNYSDIELVWNVNWCHYRTPVSNIIRESNRVIMLMQQPSFDIIANGYSNVKIGSTFYIENAMELLDEPGEFYYNKAEGMIYYYPYEQENILTAKTYVGDTELLFKISGESVDHRIKNLVFDNLKIQYGAYNLASEVGYVGGQADLSEILSDDGRSGYAAQFSVDYADNIAIQNCEFSCLGSAGISMIEAVSNSKITGNVIRDISGTGIRIGTPEHHDEIVGREVCQNIDITNNALQRVSSEFFNNAAISVYYEKNINVSHNDILDTPYTGITAGWGWEASTPYDCSNLNISYNRIKNVMTTLEDGGPIYTLGKLTGSTINNNYLIRSSSGSGAGIYLDAGSSYLDVYNNVVEKCFAWLQVQNVIYNTHDLNVHNNFADTPLWFTYGQSSTITVENPVMPQNGIWPSTANTIIENAGLEDAYENLLTSAVWPEGREKRINTPEFIFTGGITVDALSFSSSYDPSTVTVSVGQRYISFNNNEWVEYEVDVKEAGEYRLDLYAANPYSSNGAVSIMNNGVFQCQGKVQSTGSIYNVLPNQIGTINMAQGKNTIRILNTSSTGFHFTHFALLKI